MILNRFDKKKTGDLCSCGISTWMFSDENLKTNWKFLNLTKSIIKYRCFFNSLLNLITLVLHTVMECTLEVKIASRGYHVYGKSTWSNPKKGECVIGEQETDPVALLLDPYAIAWKLQKKDKLVLVVVGHIPREISQLVWYFIKYGGKVCSQVHSERPRLSPIPSGGLEILLTAKLTVSDESAGSLQI